jgi:hypothetical protein
MTDRPPDSVIAADLIWLQSHGALGGVAAVIRERRRQIEQLGYDTAHDDRHDLAELAFWSADRARRAASDIIPTAQRKLAQAAALAAAEIDRLARQA